MENAFLEWSFEEFRPEAADYCSRKGGENARSAIGGHPKPSFHNGGGFGQRPGNFRDPRSILIRIQYHLFGAGSGMAAPSLRGSEAP